MGEHNYYQMATGVSLDFRDIGYEVTRTMKRLGDRLKKEPKDNIGGAVVDRYSSSKLMRYIKNLPVAPISYVRTKAPMCKKRSIQKYTPEGRAEIHENLGFDTRMLKALLRQEVHGQSAAPHMQIIVYRSFAHSMESAPSLDKYLKPWETSIATINSPKTKVAEITTKI